MRGHEVSALYLRLNDPALITKNGQRTFDIADVVREPRRFEAASFEFSEEDGLAVRWADHHDSTYSVAWLDEHVFEQPSRPASHLWNARFAGLVPRIPFGDDESLLRTSQALVRYGVAIVTGAPLGGALDVGGWLGVVRETNYGSTFDVVDKGGAATNLAYTTAAIRSHTDNPYRDPFPGAQILACVAQSGEGGRTQLVDGFAAAERLRDVDPGAFALLSRVPHPYEYASDADEGSEGVLLRASAPVISVDQGGAVVRVAFNDRSAGKLRLPPTELRAYYEAWAAFDGLVNSDEFLARLKLRPGETLVFDNARVMHGREAYMPGAPRHLVGTYIDMDAVRSRVAAAKRAGAPELDAHEDATATVVSALESQGRFKYGEGVDMLAHALQVADVAATRNESSDAVLACLLHDVGNSPQARRLWASAGHPEAEMLVSDSDGSIGYEHHSQIGALFAATMGLPARVANAVGLHVQAKRALVGRDPSYMDELSEASIQTLKHQGGPMNSTELEAFDARDGSDVALRLRRYDDLGKEAGRTVPGLGDYERSIYEAILRGTTGGRVASSSSSSWGSRCVLV